MNATVLLFDIDGTLVATGGAGRRAMEGAFAAVCGSPEPCRHFDFSGMTDRAIAREGIVRAGHPNEATPEAIDAILAAYLERLASEVAQSPGYRVLPGVVALLERLAKIDGVAIGLGTGNVRVGAQ